MNVLEYARLQTAVASRRPAPVTQAPLPPWDASDAGGIVHTTPPPELVIPKGPDNTFLRADFNGVTLPEARWGTPPVLIGANTTPVNMLMTPMAILYPRYWQDAILTEHAERGYSHFVVAPDGWNLDANHWNPNDLRPWIEYVRSWGFLIVLWRSMPTPIDTVMEDLLSAGLIDWYIAGEEADSKLRSEDYDVITRVILERTGAAIPIGAHFTANYPSGFPRDTFLVDWSPYDGKLHLMWQADQHDSAGTQGARLYYARQRVNLGLKGDGDFGVGAPHSKVYAFETMATAQLFGQCDEAYGNLRDLELLYTTRADDRIQPMAGFGNGCRYPDGTAV